MYKYYYIISYKIVDISETFHIKKQKKITNVL